MRSRRRLAVVLAAVVLVVLAGGGTAAYFALNALAQGSATVVVFTGTLSLQKSGSSSHTNAHTGDPVRGGDRLETGAGSRAAVNFPDGSSSRMDAASVLVIKAITKSGGGWNVALQQIAGKTWNRVAQLAHGTSYQVTGPNSSATEVRGTDFAVIFDAALKAVRVDAFVGTVRVTAKSKTVTLNQGQSTTVLPNAPPTPPAPIPPGDLADPFVLFNQGTSTGQLNQGQTTAQIPGATGDGISDLTFTLDWPGSSEELVVFQPNGTEYKRVLADKPPAVVQVTAAASGEWKYQVHDVKSQPGEYWWITISKSTPAWRGSWAGNYTGRLTIGCDISGPITFQITETGTDVNLKVHITGSQRASGTCAVQGDEDYEFSASATADTLSGQGGVDATMTKTGVNTANGTITGSGGQATFQITRSAG